MDLGEELIRADCPEKYYTNKGTLLMSFLFAAFLFAFNLISSISTFDVSFSFALGIASICAVVGFFGVIFATDYANKQWHGTYISVCEKGICGNYVYRGKKKSFQLYYSDIRNAKALKLSLRKNRLMIYAKDKRSSVQVMVENPKRVADRINDKILSKTFFNK